MPGDPLLAPAGPQPPSRQRRKEARPQEILEAALAVFARKGFAATRLDEVAARAGIGKGTLYLYFSSKEELFKAVVRETLLPHLARLEAVSAAGGGPVLPLIERFLVELAQRIEARDGTDGLAAIPRLVLAEAQSFPEIARFYAEEVIARGLAALGGLLERGIRAGELRPVDVPATLPCLLAPLLLAALFESSLRPAAPTALPPATAIIAAHLALLRHGLLPEPGHG